MNKLKAAGLVILFIIAILGLTWMSQGNQFFMYKIFAPQYEKVNREVFENTPSYVIGKNNDLANYYREWNKAKTQEDKNIIETVIKSQFDGIKSEDIHSQDLRDFLTKVRGF